MLKKIAVILTFCMLFGATAMLASCAGEVDDTPTDTGEPLDSDSDTGLFIDDTDEADDEDTDEDTGADKKVKSIDVYIIAGQSNGAGYTKIDTSVLSGLWSKYATGSASIMYMGKAEYTNNVNTANVSTGVNYVKYWTTAKAGQGRSTSCMGAEVGMAKILSEQYYTYDVNTGENRQAGIIKYAHGGTSLLNSTSGENAANGNWVSPSYAAYKGLTYSGLTGGLYRNLLTQVEEGVTKLEALGFNDINIKGVFWMQGESDRGNPSEYEIAFKYFVSDLRRDLGNIMGEDLSDLAMMIGEISKTSGSAVASTVATNETFIAKQRELASEIENCYVIASGQYEINTLDGLGNSVVDSYQNDTWHWNTEEMFNIGALVGECILNNILKVETQS